MKPSIATLMRTPVWTVGMDYTAAQVEQLLAEKNLSWAPVLENGRAVVGVVSSADLLRFHEQGGDPAAVRAWQLCSYKHISVDQDTPIDVVARQMVERHVHHVVVTNARGLAGVVSSLDFVRTFFDTARGAAP
jgi:CBS domain-containing protein